MGQYCSCTGPSAAYFLTNSKVYGEKTQEKDFGPWLESREDEISGIRHFTRDRVRGL